MISSIVLLISIFQVSLSFYPIPNQLPNISLTFVSLNDFMSKQPQSLLKNPYNSPSESCLSDIKTSLNGFMGDDSIFNYIFKTGLGLNELGDYSGCKKIGGNYGQLTLEIPLPLISFGLCVPNKCTVDDGQQLRGLVVDMINESGGILGKNMTLENVKLHNVTVDNKEIAKSYAGTYWFYGIAILTVLLCIIAPILNYSTQIKNTDKSLKGIVNCFNIIANAKSLFNTENALDKNLDIFNGLRVISMFWIVLGHGLANLIMVAPVANLPDFIDQVKTRRELVLFTGGIYAVDIFFCFSGFFAAISCYQILSKPGVNLFKTFIVIMFQRYLRLFPLYLMSYLIFIYIMPKLYDGPVYYRFDFLQLGCGDYAYANFLYTNNFVDTAHRCMPWTWYLACDFQLFIIVPFLSYIVARSKKIGLLSLFGLFIFSVVLQASIIQYYHLDPNMLEMSYVDYTEKFYYPSYCRCLPYFVGIFLGWMYLSHAKKDEPAASYPLFNRINEIILNNSGVRYLMYVFGFAIMAYLVLAYPNYYMTRYLPRQQYEITLFLVGSHLFFVIALMMVVYPGCLGKCFVLRTIMSFDIFGPMAKITYCTYMFHMMIFYFYVCSSESAIYFTMFKMVMATIDVFTISYCFSIFMTLLFESPIIKLSKLMLR